MPLKINIVSNEKELAEIYKLRYKVFCEEWGYEKSGNHFNRIVTDAYDKIATHFAVQDDMQRIVGAVRLIVDSDEGFPIEKCCDLNIDKDNLPREALAEISRLVIHKDYRRRSEDKYIYGPDEERRSIGSFNYPYNYSNSDNKYYHRRFEDRYRYKNGRQRTGLSPSERRRRHELIINLYKAIYHESKRRQITHWYSLMTKGIMLLMSKFGFKFQEIGDPVDYYGIRTPYLGKLQEIEQGISSMSPELYEEFAVDL
jgi:N-acyl-L-homoserine lactone synthetase